MGSAVAVRFALRHPRLLKSLILMSPLYAGDDIPLAEASESAMRVMAEAGQRALEAGVSALRPLFEGLPLAVREVALEMMHGFDPRSVATTTRFLASRAQPLSTLRALEAVDVPVMVLPGVDPQHPAQIGELYVRHLRHPVLVEQTDPNLIERIASFCTDAFAATAT